MCTCSNNISDARSITIFEIDFNTVHVGKAPFPWSGKGAGKISRATTSAWEVFSDFPNL